MYADIWNQGATNVGEHTCYFPRVYLAVVTINMVLAQACPNDIHIADFRHFFVMKYFDSHTCYNKIICTVCSVQDGESDYICIYIRILVLSTS